VARELPPATLSDYERIMKARGGLGMAPVSTAGVCGGCRVTIRPQALVELRTGGFHHCESCGRFLYWQEPA
jgi:predicted  nucleic acid-binding Zn-ribbon protein